MKRVVAVFMVLASCLVLQAPCVLAIEKTVEYTTRGCKYELYVKASDTWQTDTLLDVTVRVTLVQKDVEDGGIQYVTNSTHAGYFLELAVGMNDTFPYASPYRTKVLYDESVNLTEDGNYWERQFRLEMGDRAAANRLARGETVNATLSLTLDLAEYGANHTLLETVWLNDYSEIAIFKPFLSQAETYVVGGVGAAAAFGLVLIGLRKSGHLPLCRLGYHDWQGYGDQVVVRWRETRALEDPTCPHPMGKLKKEDTVVSGRECRLCGLHQERKFTKNEDGEFEVAGWETTAGPPKPK